MTGRIASGKTTLARAVASRFGISFVARDDVRTFLVERTGWSERVVSGSGRWHPSTRTYELSRDICFRIAETLLDAGQTAVIEPAVHDRDPSFQCWVQERRVTAVEIHLACADVDVLYERFERRHIELHGRSPEAAGADYRDEMWARMHRSFGPLLDDADRVLTLSSCDPNTFDLDQISGWLRRMGLRGAPLV